MSNSLDPDQARRFVGPDLGPNCLLRLTADDKSRRTSGERVKSLLKLFYQLFSFDVDTRENASSGICGMILLVDSEGPDQTAQMFQLRANAQMRMRWRAYAWRRLCMCRIM